MDRVWIGYGQGIDRRSSLLFASKCGLSLLSSKELALYALYVPYRLPQIAADLVNDDLGLALGLGVRVTSG